MKLLFWSALIFAAIWWLMKKNTPGNDLTAHFEEQKALRSIGDSALGANQVGLGNFPLTTIGQTPLAGMFIDPVNNQNPFTVPRDAIMYQSEPSDFNGYNPGGV